MSRFDERQVAVLRRKLDALSYNEVLDPVSAPLVQKLLEDLVHTTESYRTLKLQHAKQAQEISSFSSKLEVLKLDAGRTSAENSQLHVQLIQQAERFDVREKEHYQHVKQLEDRVAELSYWKHQAVDRFQQVEKSNTALKKRVEELVRLGEKRSQGSYPLRDDASKILLVHETAPPQNPTPAPTVNKSTVDVLRASDARLASVQAQLAGNERELQDARQKLQNLQEQVMRRDEEISRLSAHAGEGPDIDRLSLEYRNEANENLILSLNQQVDYLTNQLSDMEEQVKNFKRMEIAVGQADAAKTEAEKKLAAAVKDNSAIQKEVQVLKKQVTQMQQKVGKAGKHGAAALDASVNAVSEASKRLSDVTVERDDLEAKLQQVTSGQMEASEQLSGLQEQLETLQFLVDEARAQADDAKQQAASAKQEAAAQSSQVSLLQTELQQAKQQLARSKQELEMKEAVLQTLQEERDSVAARLVELEKECSNGQQSSSSYHASVVELEGKLAQVESELRSANSNLAAADSEVETLRQHLKEAAEARIAASTRAAHLEDVCARLQREVDASSAQLKQARSTEEQVTLGHNDLEMELRRLKAQVSVLSSERDALQLAADAADAAARERAAQLHSSNRELGQLQGLQSRLEALHEQGRSMALKLAESESEVAQLRAEAAQAAEAAARGDGDVADLRRLLDEADADRAVLRGRVHEEEAAAASAAAKLLSVQAACKRAVAEKEVAVEELRALKQALDQEAAAGRASETSLSTAQATVSSLRRQLLVKDEEIERMQLLLKEAQQAGQSAQVREEEARAERFEYAERARRAETLVEEYETDIAMLRAEQERLTREHRRVEGGASALQEQLLQRGKEVEQLTTLSLRGDATVQEYMANLRAMASSLRAAELRCSDLSAQLAARVDEAQAATAELQEAKRVVASLDAERDHLQEELDAQAEREASLLAELELCHRQQDETHRMRAAAEGRLAHCSSRLKQSEGDTEQVRLELQRAVKELEVLGGQHEGLKDEYRAVAEDLQALVRENQVVSSELVTVGRQLESTSKELRKAEGRVVAADQAVRAREMELEDLTRAYSALAAEQRRSQAALVSLEREAQAQETALRTAREEVGSLQASLRDAEGQVGQMSLDLSAFERQVDVLTRQLSRGECDTEELDRERQQLLQELRAAQQVRFTLERGREEMQRQLAAAEGQVGGLQARLQDAASEARSMHGRWQQERVRASELEVLLASIRAHQFQEAADSPKMQVEADKKLLVSRAGQLQEQLSKSEQEVSELRSKVEVLMRERERLQVQVREGEHRVDMLRRAVASAETAGGESADLAGELSAKEAVARKLQADAEKKCADLQQKMEKLQTATEAAQKDVAGLKAEQTRLLDLLAETDCEKTQLQRDNAALHKSLAAMRASMAHRPAADTPLASSSSSASATASHGATSSGTSSDLQAKVEELERQKASLQGNLSRAGQVMSALQSELSRAQREYGFASSSLQLLAEGLEGAGSSAGTPYTPHSTTSFLTQS